MNIFTTITTKKEVQIKNKKLNSKPTPVEPANNIILETFLPEEKEGFVPADTYKVFCVDDDPTMRRAITHILKAKEYLDISSFSSGEDCILSLDLQPDIIILDFNLSPVFKNSMNGLETLRRIKEINQAVKIIILSSQKEVRIAVETLKLGAIDYIIKNNEMDSSLINSVDKIIEKIELKDSIQALSETIKRDKLMIKGYTFFILIFIISVAVLLLNG